MSPGDVLIFDNVLASVCGLLAVVNLRELRQLRAARRRLRQGVAEVEETLAVWADPPVSPQVAARLAAAAEHAAGHPGLAGFGRDLADALRRDMPGWPDVVLAVFLTDVAAWADVCQQEFDPAAGAVYLSDALKAAAADLSAMHRELSS